MKKMKIYGTYKNKKVSRNVYSKVQAYATINQMIQDGVTDISCNFDELEKLS